MLIRRICEIIEADVSANRLDFLAERLSGLCVEECDAAYDDGRAEGQAEAGSDEYADGHRVGFDEGHAIGFDEGHAAATKMD